MNKEVISCDEQHGFVFNMRTISFNEEVCAEFLNTELNLESKRELLHAYYLYTYLNNKSWTPKTGYGECEVKVNRSVQVIEKYMTAIEEKLTGHLTNEELENYIRIIEQVLELNEVELKDSAEIIIPIVKQQLRLS